MSLIRGAASALAIAFCLAFSPPLEAYGLFPAIGEDAGHLLDTAPIVSLGAGAALSTAAFLVENPYGNMGFMGHGFLEDCSEVCDAAFGWPLLGGAAALWAGGSLADAPNTEEAGQMLTEGLLLTYGFTGLLKLGAGRLRPDGSDRESFPSAHAAGTACVAVIVWDRWGPEAGIPAAVVAGFTALSRVTLGKHYPSDVIAGAAIGASIGLAVAEAHSDREGDIVVPAVKVWWDTESGLGIGI